MENERNRHDVDLLLIKLERVDNDFYESLIKFISDHGYKPKVIVHNTDNSIRQPVIHIPTSADYYGIPLIPT